ncbi:hypothetical protein JKP88DRAFT_327526 [Tribonema minus]|uniref:Sulfotransferase family protein n=1 Tax=Tribonema minus TaxID=303371 RepID=A0A835YPV5_9STRA|nr:hypothetical protein JKP88DRAFT_327526 [Tribonema minus]
MLFQNNCQSFNHLFTSLRSRYDESLLEGDIWGRNDMHSHNMTLPQLADLVYDDTWHKAVFYREPLVRYLSAYRSKCEVGHDDGFELCTALFGKPNPTFAEAVERLTQDPPVDNPHFRPQVDFCGGLGAILPQFQTVEALDPRTSRDAVAALLRRVGVADPEGVPAFNERFPPFDAAAGAWRPNDSYARHTTDAAAAVEAYYTPYLACVVVTHFLDDYLTFGVAVPEWAWRLGLRDVGGDCAALR